MNKKLHIIVIVTLFPFFGFSQSVDIENVLKAGKNKPLTFSGSLSAGSIHYASNEMFSGRQPWTYYLNGNLNTNIYGLIDIPIAINLTNLGSDLSYPSLPNRLSLHPSYKWVTAHIGDVAMTFSPYTLNGHQFTGVGVDLTPGNFKISAMGGRLLREVPYSIDNISLMPNYERWGCGAKVQYDASKFSVGMIYFGAKDKENPAMALVADSLGIMPMQNTAFNWNADLQLIKNMTLTAEYGLSLLTRDARTPLEKNNFVYDVFNVKTSTNTYHAFNTKLNYQLMKNTIGIGYEYIDPQYQTLGAYYFNNDFENVTLNFARPFLKDDKASIALSFGIQRDNLDKTKQETSNRYVGSINLNYNPTEVLQTSLNFSTFQSHRNLRSQFDVINEMSPFDNFDTLQFTQLSQNFDASVMYMFQKSETRTQSLNVIVSYQEAADRQGNIVLPGNVSRFVNSALGYNIMLIPQNINITTSINGTYSYAGLSTSYMFGPMAGISAAFFNKILSCGFSAAYNVNIVSGNTQGKVLNCRTNAAYRFWKKHNLNANVVWQNRDLPTKTSNAVTTTVAYSYSF